MVTPDANNPGNPIADGGSTPNIRLYVDAGRKAITAAIPLEYFGKGNPAEWGYAIAVMSQEGYPTEGVWRIRDVNVEADQYKFGGGPNDSNHTRIIDLALGEGHSLSQEEALSGYVSSNKSIGELTADDYAIVPLTMVK